MRRSSLAFNEAAARNVRAAQIADQIARDGTTALLDCDLVAALLDPHRHEVAERLLAHAGSVFELSRLSHRELREAGLGNREAMRLAVCLELGRRAGVEPCLPARVREPADAFRCVAAELTRRDRERFVVVVLDVKSRPRRIAVVAEGSIDLCPVDPREVFSVAVRERASAVLVAHNHPSGDPSPSADDIRLTARLVDAGELLGIPLVDHLIVGARRGGGEAYVSMAARGIIQPPARRTVAAGRSRE